MITWAARTPMPATSSRRATAESGAVASSGGPPPGPAPGAGAWAAGMAEMAASMQAVSVVIWALRASIWSSRMRASSAWWSSKLAGEGLHQGGVLDPHASLGQRREYLGVPFAGDERLDHGPPRYPHDVAGHGRQSTA